MDGQTVVGIVVGALFLAGLVGALIPWIPGPLFILIGVLVWAVATQFAVIGVGRLVILVTLALRSEEHTSELQSRLHLVCRLLLEKKKKKKIKLNLVNN